jgi:uncharacterized membrane protein
MNAACTVLVLWITFGATHVGLSSRWLRQRLCAALGAAGFQALYSLVAFASFVPLVWFYFRHKHAGPLLWQVPLGSVGRGALYTGMGLAFVLMAAGLATPSPAALGSRTTQVRGVHRITRHALFMGLGLFGLLHLVVNGFASDVAFFGGLPLFALLGCWHQDRRKLAGGDPVFRAFHAQTPFLPFTGRETARGLRELPAAVVAAGIAATVVLRWIHPWVFSR